MITILPLTTGLSGVLQSKENSINLIKLCLTFLPNKIEEWREAYTAQHALFN